MSLDDSHFDDLGTRSPSGSANSPFSDAGNMAIALRTRSPLREPNNCHKVPITDPTKLFEQLNEYLSDLTYDRLALQLYYKNNISGGNNNLLKRTVKKMEDNKKYLEANFIHREAVKKLVTVGDILSVESKIYNRKNIVCDNISYDFSWVQENIDFLSKANVSNAMHESNAKNQLTQFFETVGNLVEESHNENSAIKAVNDFKLLYNKCVQHSVLFCAARVLSCVVAKKYAYNVIVPETENIIHNYNLLRELFWIGNRWDTVNNVANEENIHIFNMFKFIKLIIHDSPWDKRYGNILNWVPLPNNKISYMFHGIQQQHTDQYGFYNDVIFIRPRSDKLINYTKKLGKRYNADLVMDNVFVNNLMSNARMLSYTFMVSLYTSLQGVHSQNIKQVVHMSGVQMLRNIINELHKNKAEISTIPYIESNAQKLFLLNAHSAEITKRSDYVTKVFKILYDFL
jgi:hypothetical protein